MSSALVAATETEAQGASYRRWSPCRCVCERSPGRLPAVIGLTMGRRARPTQASQQSPTRQGILPAADAARCGDGERDHSTPSVALRSSTSSPSGRSHDSTEGTTAVTADHDLDRPERQVRRRARRSRPLDPRHRRHVRRPSDHEAATRIAEVRVRAVRLVNGGTVSVITQIARNRRAQPGRPPSRPHVVRRSDRERPRAVGGGTARARRRARSRVQLLDLTAAPQGSASPAWSTTARASSASSAVSRPRPAGGRGPRGLLRLALRHSIAADIHYRDGFLAASPHALPAAVERELQARHEVGRAGDDGQATLRGRVQPCWRGASIAAHGRRAKSEDSARVRSRGCAASRGGRSRRASLSPLHGTGAAAPQKTGAVPRPDIVLKLIPFGAKRRAETAAYAKRHYGTSTWRLDHPHVIVEHYTASSTLAVLLLRRRHARPGARRAPGRLRALRDRPRRDDLPARPPGHDVQAHGGAQLDGVRDRARRHERPADPRQPGSALGVALADALADEQVRHPAAQRDRAQREPDEPVSPRALPRVALPDARRLAQGRHGGLPGGSRPAGPPPRRSPRAARPGAAPRVVADARRDGAQALHEAQ